MIDVLLFSLLSNHVIILNTFMVTCFVAVHVLSDNSLKVLQLSLHLFKLIING